MGPKTAMLSRTYSWRGTGRSRFRSMIWERSKRKDTRLKAIDQRKIRHTPQASAGQLTPCVLPFRFSSKSFQVACSAPSLFTKDTRNRCCFLRASSQKAPPADKCTISKEGEEGALLKISETASAAEQL